MHGADPFAHFQQHLPQRLAEAVEGAGGGADLVAAADRQLAGEVAVAGGQCTQRLLQPRQRGGQPPQQRAKHQQDQQ
ncbi:hypothetical protein D3C72_2111010 [compost metagenome]